MPGFVKDMPPPSGRVIVCLVGSTGSGKTTLAPYLAKYLNVVDVRTSDLVQQEIARKTAFAEKLAEVESAGRTHSDASLMRLVAERVAQEDCARGFLLSDFPVNLGQCQTLDQFLIAGNEKGRLRIIELCCSDDTLEQRCGTRWVHAASGKPYGTTCCAPASYTDLSEAPSSENMKDDDTGDALVRLDRDNQLLVPKNIFAYHLGTEPVLKHFGEEFCSGVDAEKDPVEVVEQCVSVLNATVLAKPLSFADKLSSGGGMMPRETNAQDAALRVVVSGDKVERRDAFHAPLDHNGKPFAVNRWK